MLLNILSTIVHDICTSLCHPHLEPVPLPLGPVLPVSNVDGLRFVTILDVDTFAYEDSCMLQTFQQVWIKAEVWALMGKELRYLVIERGYAEQ